MSEQLVQQILRIFTNGVPDPKGAISRLAAPKAEISTAVSTIVATQPPTVVKQVTAAVDPDVLAATIVKVIKNATATNLKNKIDRPNFIQAIIAFFTGKVPASPENAEKVAAALPSDVTAEAILKIIRNSLNTSKNVKKVLPAQVRKAVAVSIKNAKTPEANTAKLILKLIQNSLNAGGKLKKETAEEVIAHTGAPPINNTNSKILNIIVSALGPPEKAPEIKAKIESQPPQRPPTTTNNTANLIFRLMMNLFKTNGKMAEGPAPLLNFYPANTFRQANRPKNGRKWYFGTVNKVGTGWHLNMGGGGPPPPPGPTGPTFGPTGRPNFSKLDLSALLRWRRNNPGNKANVNSAISKLIKESLNRIRYSYSSSDRLSRLVELLRQLPVNFSGRREIVTAIIAMIREISNMNKFFNFNRNLRGVNNRNIREALDIQRRRLERRRREERRPGESYNNYERRIRRAVGGTSRYPGESNSNYERRRRERENTNAIRRAITRAEPPRPRPTNYGVGSRGNENAIRRALGGPPAPPSGNYGSGGGAPPPPLPPSQTAAINAAGGPANAVQTVALVPGGAPEVAKAAEALNETGGNVRLAINMKGASPAAINAVQKLGGVSQTVKILEGLNTMAQTPETQRRKAARPRTRRPKKSPIRLTELNRVINAVKKQKLISLMAHNITRTNNIHPNDEKLKKHYKKVMKSYILKTKFANIAKRAAKKRVQ